MNPQTTRFLQQEVVRLQQENQAQQVRIHHLGRYIELLAALYWAAQEMPRQDHPLETLERYLHRVIETVGARDGSLMYWESEAARLRFVLVHGALRDRLPGFCIPGDAGVAGWIVENRMPVIVNNPRQDWRFSQVVDREFTFLTRSILGVPVLRDGRLLGLIELLNKPPRGFEEADKTIVTVLADVASLAILQAEARGLPIGVQPPEEAPLDLLAPLS